MKIKEIIKSFEEKNSTLDDQVRNLKILFTNEQKFWRMVENLDKEFLVNCKIFNIIADGLQLVNDEHLLHEYELSDIRKMYQLLADYYPENIQYKIDQIEFLYRVMDKDIEAVSLIKEAIDDLDKKKKYLVALLEEI